MFHCLPNEGKCEWSNLYGFVNNYNRIYSTNYTLAECLDIHPSGRKKPEFRLKSVGERDIVLEHKIIPWPQDHLRNHRAQHDFFEYVGRKLNADFSDALYILEANASDLIPVKRKIDSMVSVIAKRIISNRERIQKEGYIRDTEPIPWHFRMISEIERDDSMPAAGVGVHLNVPDISANFSDEDEKEMNGGILNKFIGHLGTASEKFVDFDECIKIFVTEIYSDNYLVSHELIDELAKEVFVPEIMTKFGLAILSG